MVILMKKLLFILTILFMPLLVHANEYKVLNHIIDAEIEIAGGLNVKELILVEGDTSFISRNLNYYSFDNKPWDNKTIDLDNGTIYNGKDISNLVVSAFTVKDDITFDDFNKDMKDFKELDISSPKKETYTIKDDKNGNLNVKVFYPIKKNQKVAIYLNYVVTNVIVSHNDVSELNYTFKNLKYNSDKTLLRVIIPYKTTSKLYNVWVHGNQSGIVEELIDKDKNKLGIVASFPTIEKEINVRMTLPKEQVSIDMFLNKSKKDALKEIKKIENNKLKNTTTNNKINNIIKYVLSIVGILYFITAFIFIKYYNNKILIVYTLLGIFIMLFNYLFKFNFIYLYLILIGPLFVLIWNKIKSK